MRREGGDLFQWEVASVGGVSRGQGMSRQPALRRLV